MRTLLRALKWTAFDSKLSKHLPPTTFGVAIGQRAVSVQMFPPDATTRRRVQHYAGSTQGSVSACQTGSSLSSGKSQRTASRSFFHVQNTVDQQDQAVTAEGGDGLTSPSSCQGSCPVRTDNTSPNAPLIRGQWRGVNSWLTVGQEFRSWPFSQLCAAQTSRLGLPDKAGFRPARG